MSQPRFCYSMTVCVLALALVVPESAFSDALRAAGRDAVPQTPTVNDDFYSTSSSQPIRIPAPGILANDDSNDGGPMTVEVVNRGVFLIGTDGSLAFDPVGGSGPATFTATYRARNSVGLSDNIATITVFVSGLPLPPSPTGLYASSIEGNIVTLRWNYFSSLFLWGSNVTYVVEGGLYPGHVLASIRTGSTLPIFTFSAPSGAFYVRVHVLVGNRKTGASNEIPIFVNVPAAPSPPAGLLSLVHGTNLTLAWRNTQGGGPPTALELDVHGSVDGTVPLPVTETISFPDVPPGTYTVNLRAANAMGTSEPSNSVTFTVPHECTGVPLPPVNFFATTAGNQLSIFWDLPINGPAPAGFVVNVSGTFTGSFATTSRSLSGIVPTGGYQLFMYAFNQCGNSFRTDSLTVSIP